MKRILRIDLAYDGSAFHGWQIQSQLRTVQGDLSQSISRLLGRDVKPTGAGRTDTGVHALGQVAHLAFQSEAELERLSRALKRVVPGDMEILSLREVSPDFEARFSAIWRRYEYRLRMGYDLFKRNLEWQIRGGLDRTAMASAAELFCGTGDYSSFCKTTSRKLNNDCTVQECRFDWQNESAIFHIRANRFLHHMVRILVGTLIEVGKGLRNPGEIPEILAMRNRSAAGKMAPAHGLYLAEVGYPEMLSDPQFRIDDAGLNPATDE